MLAKSHKLSSIDSSKLNTMLKYQKSLKIYGKPFFYKKICVFVESTSKGNL